MPFSNITSKSNPKIKLLKSLSRKKERQKNQKFLVESEKIIRDALVSGYHPEDLFVTPEFQVSNQSLLEEVEKKISPNIFIISESLNKEFSSLVTPSGICAIYPFVDSKFSTKKSLVYLNNISDPGNLGGILRVSLAFGFNNIVIDEESADMYNPKTIQAARDSIFKLNISFDQQRAHFMKIAKKIKIITSDVVGDGSFQDVDTNEQFCVIFGNEANGISDDIKNEANIKLRIQISPNIESLNVLSAASIILHQLSNVK